MNTDKTNARPTLEVVIPIFNEESCVAELYRRLCDLRMLLGDRTHTSFLFINDGSRDKTLAILTEIAARDKAVRVIDLSRNFGHQLALTAGLDCTEADFVAVIDGDLQDPPELVAQMLTELESGYDIVYGLRDKRKGEKIFKKVTAHFFYRILNSLCEVEIPQDTGDFRIMRRKVVLALGKMRERHRFIRGMIPWSGFRSKAFLYDRDERYAGVTKYSVRKMMRFALDAIISFSYKPLRLATYTGLIMLVLGALGLASIAYVKLFTDAGVSQLSIFISSLLVVSGVQSLFLGLIGEYMSRIFEEAKARPLYNINALVGFSSENTAHNRTTLLDGKPPPSNLRA